MKETKELFQKASLEDGEATLLLKTILHPEFHHRDQLQLSHPERGFWSEVSLEDEKKAESYYQQALADGLQKKALVTSHHHLLKHPELLDHFERLILLEPQLIEDNATRMFGKRLDKDDWDRLGTEESWAEFGEKFFQQLNIFGNT